MPIAKNSSGATGGGSGTVTNVSSADTSIAVSNPTTTPVLQLATLDVIATNEPTAASVPMNSQKLTGLAAGTGNGDSVRYEQVLKSGAVTAADTSIVIAGTGVAPTIATGTLDVIAADHPPAADWSNNSHKITSLANGSAATDAAAFGQLSGLGYGLSIFGDGSDGSVTFDGTTTILGMAPSSSVYTLTRDFYFSAVTINNGVQIKTNGFRFFCSGTLTNNGTIQWNGNAASGTNGGTGGAGLNNANSSFSAGTGGSSAGTSGATGGTGNGSAGTNASTNFSLGGVGGAGGTGATSTAGAGGTLNANVAVNGSIRAAPAAVFAITLGSGGTIRYIGGTGGGAGGGDATNVGGGGGSGGGLVMVCARTIAGTGAIQARGGNGGTVTTSTLGAGGGGGGGGGVVIVISQSVVSGAVTGQTIDANGGTKGTGLGTTHTDGSNGNAGTVIALTA